MFGSRKWQLEMQAKLETMEQELAQLRRSDLELRTNLQRVQQMLRNTASKLVNRLPLSIESLEKNLDYDLIFWDEIQAWRKSVSGGLLLDLRAKPDYAKGSILGAYNLPFEQLTQRYESIPRDQPILLICDNGIKSVAAFELLQSKSFSFLYVLKGGMNLFGGELHIAPAPSEAQSSDADQIAI